MQHLANLEVFNGLQATANAAMGYEMGAFNGDAVTGGAVVDNGSGGEKTLERKLDAARRRYNKEEDPNKKDELMRESERLTQRHEDRIDDGRERAGTSWVSKKRNKQYRYYG